MAATALPIGAATGAREFGLPHDRYHFVRQLQKGGQGEVHICKRLTTGNEYAVKTVSGRAMRRHPALELFLRREIRCLRELQHTNIVNLHAAFWEAGSCFIVMDLAREGDLSDHIDRCTGLGRDPMNSDFATKYVVAQLLAGIGYMHSRRVIHRDLKLENVLISRSGTASEPLSCLLHDIKITDFGLSTWLDIDGEAMTPVGTPEYFAPEIVRDDYDMRIDFFSLGVLVYVMLCGNFPFEACNDATGYESGTGSPQPEQREMVESYSWSAVSNTGKDFVKGLLAHDPDKRLNHGECLGHAWLATRDTTGELESKPEERKESKEAYEPDGVRYIDRVATGAIEKIEGWIGSATDSIQITRRSGEEIRFGAPGGYAKIGHVFEPDECIIAVAQETRGLAPPCLGNSIVFFTSACKVVALQGADARRRRRFVAPLDRQIVGLQFQNSCLTGVHLDRIPSDGAGSVEQISGRVGSAVDEISLKLRSGEERHYGKAGGSLRGPWTLEGNEQIVIVEQARRDAHLGTSVVFYTTAGKVYKLSGMESSESRRFVVMPGRQVCDLSFDRERGFLLSVGTCPRDVRNPRAEEVEHYSVVD